MASPVRNGLEWGVSKENDPTSRSISASQRASLCRRVLTKDLLVPDRSAPGPTGLLLTVQKVQEAKNSFQKQGATKSMH